ncbi:MAG TPA: hypothetical protein VHO69_11500 [Phototrophicaceae bacterium]|nr:hypothetical protein [Phototrophicaceae bacterium]
MRQLTMERAAVIILFALLFALAARIPTDTDTWWHIRSGEYTLTHGMIYADPFSFTKAGQPWINHSWGAQLMLYGVWQLAGNFGLAVYTAGLATAGMAFVYKMSPGSVYLRALTLVLGAAAAAVFWSPRPQMLSFALSAGVLYLLWLYKRRGIDRLWWLPVIMGVWGNLHAGFSIGFIFLFGLMAGEVLNHLFRPGAENVISWVGLRKLVLVTVVSAAALVMNPYGLQMLAVPFQTVSIGALQNFIQEWNSPNFHDRSTWPFIALLLGLLGAAGASRKRLDWTGFVLVSGTAFMGLSAGRNIAVFAVVATPILTEQLDAVLTERSWDIQPMRRVTPRLARLNAVLVAVIVLVAAAKVLLVLDAKTVQKAQEESLPVKVTEYLQSEHPSGPMFNSYNWGGYLMFALPETPVFVDGRTDLYGDDFLTNVYYQTAVGGETWRETLNQYGIRLVVVEAGSGLARQLRVEPGWTLDYEDQQAVVFTREAVN